MDAGRLLELLDAQGGPDDAAIGPPTETVTLLFERWTLPVKLIVSGYPVPGQFLPIVYDDWVRATEVVLPIRKEVPFPLITRAYRYPLAIDSHVHNGRKVVINDPSTWTDEMRWRGVQHASAVIGGQVVSDCMHKPKCPRPLDFPSGIILDNETRWVILWNHQPMREEEYIQMRSQQATAPVVVPPVVKTPEAAQKATEAAIPALKTSGKGVVASGN